MKQQQHQPDSWKHWWDTGMNQVLKYSIKNKIRGNELFRKQINIYSGVSVGWLKAVTACKIEKGMKNRKQDIIKMHIQGIGQGEAWQESTLQK